MIDLRIGSPSSRGRQAAALALLALLAGCTVGPDYQRPEVELPASYNVAQAPVPAADRWWTLFNDPVLDRLVDEALVHNRDLRAAAERIEQARAQFAITRNGGFGHESLAFSIDSRNGADRAITLGLLRLKRWG